MPSHYDDVDLTLPQYIQDAAAKGLVYLDEGLGGDGLTDGTIAEARAMARGDVAADKVRRASAWGALPVGHRPARPRSDRRTRGRSGHGHGEGPIEGDPGEVAR